MSSGWKGPDLQSILEKFLWHSLDFYSTFDQCQWSMLRMGMMGTGLHFNLDKFQHDFTRVQNFDVLTDYLRIHSKSSVLVKRT